jgi:hypothetical protein
MNFRLFSIGRILAASICGVIQFMVVIGGVAYWKNFAQHHFPDLEVLSGNWGAVGAMIGLLSLLWPVYVFVAAKIEFNKQIKNLKEK